LLRNILILCMLLTFLLAGCFTAAEQGDNPNQTLEQENAQLKKLISAQNQKIKALQREIANLRDDRDTGEEQNVDSPITVERLKVISDQAYTTGKNAGAVYGKFNVSARIKNVSNVNRSNVKVTAVFQRTQKGYPKAKPNIQTVMYTIPTLKAGQTAMITFRGFKVDHPELIQEVIIHPVAYNDISKIRVKAVFPPNTQD